ALPIFADLLATPYALGSREEVTEIMRGYVAGYNEAVAEGGITDTRCAGEPWVRAISEEDAWKYVYVRLMYAGLGQAAMGIAQAHGGHGTGSPVAPRAREAAGAAPQVPRERALGGDGAGA